MAVFTSPYFDQHEALNFCHDQETGLKAIIAIHNTVLGPAVGGCRMFDYSSEQAAIDDVLRLSKGMSYKAAMAKLPYGGGKSVIIGDPRREKSTAKLHAMADFVNRCQGRYITAADSGTTTEDLNLIGQKTAYVFGADDTTTLNAQTINPSPATAYGVFLGIKQALKHQRGCDDLCGIKIAIQGVGNVGFALSQLLHDAGARLWVSDSYHKNLRRAVDQFDASVVSCDNIHRSEVDIFSPCAMGLALNNDTVNSIKADIIAGSANNQCSGLDIAESLHRRSILLCPDYVINAGGLIYLAHHYAKSNPDLTQLLSAISDNLQQIFTTAAATNDNPTQVANTIAEGRLSAAHEARHVLAES